MEASVLTAPPLPAARRLLRGARRSWRRTLLVRAALASLAVAVGGAALLLALDLVYPLPPGARAVLRWLPLGGGAVPLAIALRRIVPGPDDRQLALLLEERFPQLERTLSTALETIQDGPVARAFRARADARLAEVDGSHVAPLRSVGLTAALATGAVALTLVLAAAPSGADGVWQRWVRLAETGGPGAADRDPAAPGSQAGPRGAAAADALSALEVTVEPPAYSGLPARRWEGEEVLSALPGSRIRVRGEAVGRAEVSARVIGGSELRVLPGERWTTGWTLAAGERGLSLESSIDGAVVGRRIVPLAPLPDSPPAVEWSGAAEDLLVASPRGEVVLRAGARDDYGVAEFYVDWIRSRGSGESFSFEEGRWAWSGVGRERSTLLGEHRIDLGGLGLEPGDVLHLRAVARDGNTVTGPGEGVSRTRMIRVALPDEMAEVTTLTGFPIEADREPVLSQRMVILLTERLLARAEGLEREELVREAEEIAGEQARLRERVGDQALAPSSGAEEVEAAGSHDHDANPVLSVNRPLLEAYNAMWAAEGSLRIAELRESLPYQYEALRIMQEMRQAERIFLRGRQQVAPVDVAAARGTGELDEALPAPRTPVRAAPAVAGRRAELESLISGLERLEPRAASLELGALAGRLLAEPAGDAAVAALVVRAAEAARMGHAEEALRLAVRARALLSPGAAVAGGASAPGAVLDPAAAGYFRLLGARRR